METVRPGHEFCMKYILGSSNMNMAHNDERSIFPTDVSECKFRIFLHDLSCDPDNGSTPGVAFTASKMCHRESNEWIANYKSLVFSILHLYIFADEYLVLQLHHDAIIVFVEQCQTMEWRPDPDSELVAACRDTALPTVPRKPKKVAMLT
ncbi:hypothetical protein EJ07DRAFT_175291 [Lizonia empirigonia]|nr:hypothetical protein EJ07DRAFT_175291 [Lizonia empirigonia]